MRPFLERRKNAVQFLDGGGSRLPHPGVAGDVHIKIGLGGYLHNPPVQAHGLHQIGGGDRLPDAEGVVVGVDACLQITQQPAGVAELLQQPQARFRGRGRLQQVQGGPQIVDRVFVCKETERPPRRLAQIFNGLSRGRRPGRSDAPSSRTSPRADRRRWFPWRSPHGGGTRACA